MIFYLIVLLLIVQRLHEMKLGKKNLERLSEDLIYPLNVVERNQMLILHSLWFLSLFTEYYFRGELIGNVPMITAIIILIIFQILRFYIMKSLGVYWTPYPVAFKNQKILTSGMYRFIRHPNYLIVIGEFIIVPLIGKCLWTAVIFSTLNILFLRNRIKIEENALQQMPDYKGLNMKKKLIPFIFGIFTILRSEAGSIGFSSKKFKEAKNASNYFMFTGESTKFGFITTSYDGYAKEGHLNYAEENGKIKNIVLELKSSKIDTDNSLRDEKMHELCLEVKKFPLIKVEIPEIDSVKEDQKVSGTMFLRNKSIPLDVHIHKTGPHTFTGDSEFKFADTEMPDPSIAIAKIKDEFKIHFQVNLSE